MSAEARGEQDLLLDYALFKDGLVRVGLLIANMDSLVLHGANEGVCLIFLEEFMGILSGAVLLQEENVLKSGEVAGGLGDCDDFAAGDTAFDGGPALSVLFVASLLPSAEIEPTPCSLRIR